MASFRDSFAAYMIGVGALAATPAAHTSAQNAQQSPSKENTSSAVVQKTSENSIVSEKTATGKQNAQTHEEMFRDFKEIVDCTKFADFFKEQVQGSNDPSILKKNDLNLTPTARIISASDVDKTARSDPLTDNLSNLNPSLSLQDYQSVCAYRCVEDTSLKLMALCAQGKQKEADAILPGFSKKYKDKIRVSQNNTSMDGKDWVELKNDISKNFNKVFPDFDKRTQTEWKNGEDFRSFGTISLNDNQFINVAATKYYDVTNPENRRIAAETRQQYNDIVNRSKANSRSGEKSKASVAQAQQKGTKVLTPAEIMRAYRYGKTKEQALAQAQGTTQSPAVRNAQKTMPNALSQARDARLASVRS